MASIKLICIRHGQSEANVDHKLYETLPDYTIPLTETGRHQARELGIELNTTFPLMDNPRYLIHSPWVRARQTSEEIMSNLFIDMKIVEDPLIHEISLSHSLEEMKTKEFFLKEKDDYGHFYFKEGTSESYNDVYKRARLFVQELRFNPHNIANASNVFVVSHGLFLIMLKGVLNNLTIKEILEERWLSNCQYFISHMDIQG